MTASELNAHGQPVGLPVAEEFPRPRPPRGEMQGRLCSVVPFEDAHIPALFRALCGAGSEPNWTYLPYGPFDTEADFADWARETCTGDDPLFHTIMVEGKPAGLASYLRIAPEPATIEVGHIHFGAALQRHPAATEAMYLMATRAFDELGYRRYEWKCDAHNARSRRAAERLGFRFEGVFRQAGHPKGRNRDTAWYSIIDGEWPAIRAALEAWLDPENFDTSGVQLAPLSTPSA